MTFRMVAHPQIGDSEWLAVIRGLQAGEPAVLHRFYAEFGPVLRALAHQRVSPLMQRRFDADDVVQSTLRTFFRRAQVGEFLFEDNRRLWSLLCAITLTKLREKTRFHQRQSRATAREEPLDEGTRRNDSKQCLTARGPAPDATFEFAEEFEHLLAGLEEREQRLVNLKLQDLTNDEAAEALDISERTVQRMLHELQVKFMQLLERHAR